MSTKKIYKAFQEETQKKWLNYILLPYGEFYTKTKNILNAKAGDTLRFFNGPEVSIERVMLIACDGVCDFLCKMRYGVTWDIAFRKWLSYARMEGNGKDILSKSKCILVVYYAEDKV